MGSIAYNTAQFAGLIFIFLVLDSSFIDLPTARYLVQLRDRPPMELI